MYLKNILSISECPGLFEEIAQTNVGEVAIPFIDEKRVITSVSWQFSMLDEFQIYCKGNEITLIEVLEKILNRESGKSLNIKLKANANDLHAYFLGIIEKHDTNRVCSSDINKINQWCNILLRSKKLKNKIKQL
ncbi:MAG: hypothetical protein CBD39_02045 [Flavobacteriaceae bacterium TMED179]|nr:MAG: hypothetical protein CBD39_02045 [Flavobacteriaceae bacterium TMED179]|tara:strand:- start:34564 stop:34965 length:402 start_codon:yes stop_codon:yes gene_type:complete